MKITINHRMKPLSILLFAITMMLIGCTTQQSITSVTEPKQLETATIIHPTQTESLPPTQEVELTATLEPSPTSDISDDYSAIDPTGQVITFWHPFQGEQEAGLVNLVNEFNNSNPWGILVKQTYEGRTDDIHMKALTFLGNEDSPSILVTTGSQAAAYQFEEALVDINTLIGSQTWGFSDLEILDIYPGLIQQGIFPSFNNQRLTFPLFGRMNVLYYNLDWLAEMGYETVPTSPENFIEAACTATIQPFSGSTASGRTGILLNSYPGSFAEWSMVFGGNLFDFGMNQYQFESESVYNAMSFLQSLIARGCGTTEPQASVSSPSEGAMIDFSRGTLLFVVDSTDKIPEFRKNIQSEANFNWRIAPLPHTTFNPVNIVQGVNASIPKTDPKQELASWLFIKFFTSPENQAKWVRETNTLPIRAGATEFLSDYFSTSPAAQMTLEMMGSSTHEPSVPGYSQVQALSRETLSAILNGADISTELAVLTSDANSILEGQIVLIPEAPDPWIEVDPSGQTVRFWHQQNQPRLSVLEEIINDFNAKNKWGITVVPEVHQSYGVIFQELLPILGTEEVPDLVLAYQHHAAAYHEAGGLIDINSILLSTKWGLPSQDSEDIYQAIFKQDIFPIFESSRLGFPLQRSTDILYFNADLLEELGYESPPANMEEFIEIACKAARSPGSTEPRMGYHFYVDATRFASWVFAFGGTVFNDAQNLFEFNNPESNSVIQTLQTMFESGCAVPITDRLTSQTAFSEGSLLFMIDSSYHISTIEDFVSNNAGFDWGVAQMPTLSGSPVQNLFGASLSIPKSSRERELAAWLFIMYLAEPQVQAQWGMGAGYLPIRRGAVEFLKTYFVENPNYHSSYKLLKYGITEPSLPGYDFVHQELELALQAIFLPEDIDDEEQEINVLEILNSLNATVNQILLTHLER